MRVLKQSALGLAVVVASFIGGTVLCEFCIPDTGVKYLNERGEMVVGALIFCITLAVALLARFDKRALFITAGLVPSLIIVFAVLLVSATSSSGIYWTGLFRDTLVVSRHTTLPVILSAVAVLLIRFIRAQDAAPNGGPATQPGNSEVTEGPPSVSMNR